jgi:hypothetical protein
MCSITVTLGCDKDDDGRDIVDWDKVPNLPKGWSWEVEGDGNDCECEGKDKNCELCAGNGYTASFYVYGPESTKNIQKVAKLLRNYFENEEGWETGFTLTLLDKDDNEIEEKR